MTANNAWWCGAKIITKKNKTTKTATKDLGKKGREDQEGKWKRRKKGGRCVCVCVCVRACIYVFIFVFMCTCMHVFVACESEREGEKKEEKNPQWSLNFTLDGLYICLAQH